MYPIFPSTFTVYSKFRKAFFLNSSTELLPTGTDNCIYRKRYITLTRTCQFVYCLTRTYLALFLHVFSHSRLVETSTFTFRHSAHEAIRTHFERFSTPVRVRTTSWKQVSILMCALTLQARSQTSSSRVVCAVPYTYTPRKIKIEGNIWKTQF